MVYANNLPVELKPGQKIIQDLRAVKSREELQLLIDAQRISEKAYLATIPLIRRDMTELDLFREFSSQFYKAGADGIAFGPIVVSGTHSSVPHGQADNRKLGDGFLTLDFGAKLNGYNSDTTRTLCIGEPTKEMEKVYNTVLDAQVTAIKAARAGMEGRELDAVARNVIAEAGYGEYFSHSLSHGLGIDVHEAPSCSTSATGILPAGAVISMEPGIYIPGKFGVRIEDVIYLTETGCEDITDLPKELTVICK
jgi:Xaa-Pro aminopeptidase